MQKAFESGGDLLSTSKSVGDEATEAVPSLLEIEADDFARRFSMRGGNMMWLLGAGVSAAAGIPTAGDMIWEFKQKLFISQRRASPEMVADLSAPGVRQHLQAHIDAMPNMPSAGAPDEYSVLFETVFPAEADRRTYLDAKMAGAKPSYGHVALATLMHADHAKLAWTTNFDPLIADACAKVFDGTGALTTVALDAPDLARQVVSDSRWPIEVKLHGDFRSRQLKNTSDELRHQDQQLRDVLIDSCQRYGLIIGGYSGRDDSIMDALESAMDKSGSFPSGLFWLHRGDTLPYSRVSSLLLKAHAKGVEAALVRVPSFDEAMRDIVRLVNGLDTKVLNEFGKQRPRWTAAPMPAGKGSWPVIRLNALRVSLTPSVCRRIVCEIGGYGEIRRAVGEAEVDLLVARTRAGVLAFGSDVAAKSAFDAYNITGFDLASIESRRLRYESAERGLLREAIVRAVCGAREMTQIRKRSLDLLYPQDPAARELHALQAIVGSCSGQVSDVDDLEWREGIGVRLEWAADSLWLLFDPMLIFTNITLENRAAASDFARERTFDRYNKKLDALIDFWSKYIVGDGELLRAMNVSDGVDASFQFDRRTAFSRRISA
jgi:NAD-dependent SIR2 family protein deacetylase